MIPKLSGACYAVRSKVLISNSNTLKSIYYVYFYSIMKYGEILWSYSSNSGKIFMLQKKIISIMAGEQLRTSCRSLLKQLEILHVPHQYFALTIFIINNKDIFQTHSSIHNITTRNKHHLHRPSANLPCFQVSMFYAGIKIFNSLPPIVTILKNDKARFKAPLGKHYIHTPHTL